MGTEIDAAAEAAAAIRNKAQHRQIQPPQAQEPSQEQQQLIMSLQDILARIDITVSETMNTITNLNNAKNHYLKLLGHMRQERQQGDSISSK
jgi:hypothetical protein